MEHYDYHGEDSYLTTAVAAAKTALEATETDEGYIYWDDATGAYWQVDARDMASLGAALLDGRPLHEVYSPWCTLSLSAEEVEVELPD